MRTVQLKVHGTPIEVTVPQDGSPGTTVFIKDSEGNNICGLLVNGETVKIGYWDEDDAWIQLARLRAPRADINWRSERSDHE